MAIKKTLLVLACLTLVQSAFTMSNTNNGRGNRGGGIHGQLNGQQQVSNSRLRELLPEEFQHIFADDSEDETDETEPSAARHRQNVDTGDDASEEETSEPTVFVRPIIKIPQGLSIQGGRGNNNGNNNNDGRSHGNGCNTNNNGNNNEDDDCQGGKTEKEQVTVVVPPAPVHRKRPAVDGGNDGAAGKPGPVDSTSDDLDFDKIDEDLDNFDIDMGDLEDDYIYSDEEHDDRSPESEDDRFNYRSLFSDSRLARIMDYRYWLRRFLPRYREYYRPRNNY